MKPKPDTPTASETYLALVAELDELRGEHPADATLSVDELTAALTNRHMRAQAIELVLPRYKVAHLYHELELAKAAGVAAGNRLVEAAAARGTAERQYDEAVALRAATLAPLADEHNSANSAATNAWELEAQALENLRLLGEPV